MNHLSDLLSVLNDLIFKPLPPPLVTVHVVDMGYTFVSD